MDYSRLMMGIGTGGSGSGSDSGSDNPSVEPTTQTISDYFAEPNLPQQYTESLGAPFGDRYVYTIFMQGINVLPDIPSSADGSELTARVKEVSENDYSIVEYYYIKQEGEWESEGSDVISSWTEETESSGDGGNVFLEIGSVGDLLLEGRGISFNTVNNLVSKGTIPWLLANDAGAIVLMPLAAFGAAGGGYSVNFAFGNELMIFTASSDREVLRHNVSESEDHSAQ